MNDRRRFLHVLGATTAAVAIPACGGSETTTSTASTGAGGAGGGTSATSGTGGTGGTGGTDATSSTTSATASSSASTGGGACEMNPAGIAVGIPDDFGTDGLHLVPSTKVIVGRDAKGLYAITSICPHEFCDMDGKTLGQPTGTVTAEGVTCNCHGSKFDNYGKVLKGPAIKPLKAYAMVLGCDGKLYVDKTSVVSIDQRLAV